MSGVLRVTNRTINELGRHNTGHGTREEYVGILFRADFSTEAWKDAVDYPMEREKPEVATRPIIACGDPRATRAESQQLHIVIHHQHVEGVAESYISAISPTNKGSVWGFPLCFGKWKISSAPQ